MADPLIVEKLRAMAARSGRITVFDDAIFQDALDEILRLRGALEERVATRVGIIGEHRLQDVADILFVGRTIAKIEASSCNNIEFLFIDGGRVALHIECDAMGLPDVAACVDCAEIE